MDAPEKEKARQVLDVLSGKNKSFLRTCEALVRRIYEKMSDAAESSEIRDCVDDTPENYAER
jgi:hypothetical protein